MMHFLAFEERSVNAPLFAIAAGKYERAFACARPNLKGHIRTFYR
jgi:hypothetical protein